MPTRCHGGTSQAPVMPSQRLLRFFASLPCSDIIPPLGAACELPRAGRRLGLEPAPMERLVAAVRLGASLKNLRSIQAAVSAASTLLASNVAVLPCVGSRRLPRKQTFAESSCAAGCLCHAVQSVARLHKASGGSCGTLRRARLRR